MTAAEALGQPPSRIPERAGRAPDTPSAQPEHRYQREVGRVYYWDLRGRERSAGTFARKKDAGRSWQAAEARVAEGRAMGPSAWPAGAPGVRGPYVAAQPCDGAEHAGLRRGERSPNPGTRRLADDMGGRGQRR